MTSFRLYALNAATALAVSAAAMTAGTGPVAAREQHDDGWKALAGIAAAAIAINALTPHEAGPAPMVMRAAPPAPVYVEPPAVRYVPAPVYAPPPPAWRDGGWGDAEGDWQDEGWNRHHHHRRPAPPPVYYVQPGWSPWH